MQRKSLIAAAIALALLIVLGGLWLLMWRGPSGEQLQALRAIPGDTVVTLTWPASAGASGCNVYRDGNPTPVNSTPISGTTYEDIGLTNGRTYTYTVAPARSAGASGASNASGQPTLQVSVAPTSK